MKHRLYILLLLVAAGLLSAVSIHHRTAEETVSCQDGNPCKTDNQSKNEQTGLDRFEFSPIRQILDGI